jgi:hypothetical protein
MLWFRRDRAATNGRFAGAARSALIGSMTPSEHLTRRPDPHRRDCWLIYCADIYVGTIALAVGVPGSAAVGVALRVLSRRLTGRISERIGPTFEKARAQFERAWKVFALADYQGMAGSAGLDRAEIFLAGPEPAGAAAMKYTNERPYSVPEKAARRMSFTTRSAGALSGPDFCFIFAPCGYDEPEILPP